MKDRNQKLIIFGAILLGPVIFALAQGLPNMAPFQTKAASILQLLSQVASFSSMNGVVNPASGLAPYTADATGASDSTIPIQAAIDAMYARGGGIVELPAGTYKVGSAGYPVYMRSNVTLRGAGSGALIKPVNGRTATITSWNCVATSGTCVSGTGPYTLTLNLATQVFNGLQNTDSFCNPTGSTCQLFTYFGFAANPGNGFFAMNGTNLDPVFTGDNRPTLPTASWWTATSFTIQSNTPPTANSGTSGTFFIPYQGVQVYDARAGQFANATNYAFQNLTFDGGCAKCDSTRFAFLNSLLDIRARGNGQPTVYTGGTVSNVRLKNAATDAIYFQSNDTTNIVNVTCDTIGEGCIDGQDASNMFVSNVTARAMGFPVKGGIGAVHFTALYNHLITSANTHNTRISNVYFEPNADDSSLGPFGIVMFQNGASPDTAHLLYSGVVIDNYSQTDACLQNGGLISAFADNMTISNIYDDISKCPTVPINPSEVGFVEIGGSNNHVTHGMNVHVQWAGIRSDYKHAENIEVDNVSWRAGSNNNSVVGISGAQGGATVTGCTIKNVNIHDNQGYYRITAAQGGAALAGIGYGEGQADCTISDVEVHHNQANFDTTGGVPSINNIGAIALLGQGSNYRFHDNQFFGFPAYISAECNNGLASGNVGATVASLYVKDEVSDTPIGSLVINKTSGPGCPNNWTGVTGGYQASTWNGIDYNLAHTSVTGSIAGSASACVTGTATSAFYKVGALAAASRTDGAARQDNTTVSASVITNGTATVKVCSGTTPEPAGTYNVTASNPQ